MMNEYQMDEKPTAEQFGEYLDVLWRRLWILILVAVVASGVAYFVAWQQTPVYESSTLVLVNAAPSALTDSYSTIIASQQLLETYAEIMTTQTLLDKVKQQLGLTDLTATIEVQPVQNTQLLKVIVRDTDPVRAALIANTLVTVFTDQLRADQTARYSDSKQALEDQMASLQEQIQTRTDSLNALPDTPENQTARSNLQSSLTQYQNSYTYVIQSYAQLRLAEAQSTSTISQKDPALPENEPIRPRPLLSAALAGMIGVMLAVGALFLNEYLDDTIRDPQEIARKWGVPILGIIPRFKAAESELITLKQPRSPVSEAFRALRTNLEFAGVDEPLKTILITSTFPQDGKTTISANLAAVFAQSNRNVLLVDADLRRPQLHKPFRITNRIGLTDQLIQSQRLVHVGYTDQNPPPKERTEGFMQGTELAGLKVIPSGSLPPDPSELLGSLKMQEMMGSLMDQFDCIIIDTPPVLLVTDAVVLAPRVSGVIVVVQPSVTTRAGLRQVIDQLKQVNARVLGVVFNNVDVKRSRYYYKRYYSSYTKKHARGYYAQKANAEKKKQNEAPRFFL